MTHTFTVNKDNISEWWESRLERDSWTKYAEVEGQCMSRTKTKVFQGHKNAYFDALSTAFNQHVPLVLKPDTTWLCILNGLSHHIDEDPEGLRRHFVEHEGKERIEVKVDSPDPPYAPDEVWEQGIKLFSGELQKYLGKKHDLIVCDFTTTDETDRLASEVMLMGAMKHYFDYRMLFCCNLTNVTVLGEPKDWEDIKNRLGAMSEFNLQWWTQELVPIIDQFKESCAGNPDLSFWKRMFVREGKGSGGQYGFGGWLCSFFPYLMAEGGKRVRNPKVNWASPGTIDPEDIPASISSVPVTVVKQDGSEHDFKFYGGLVGCTYEKAIEPISGWSIQQLGEEVT